MRTEIWKEIYKALAVDGGVTGAVDAVAARTTAGSAGVVNAVAAAAAAVRLEAAHAHTSRDMREFSQTHQALSAQSVIPLPGDGHRRTAEMNIFATRAGVRLQGSKKRKLVDKRIRTRSAAWNTSRLLGRLSRSSVAALAPLGI